MVTVDCRGQAHRLLMVTFEAPTGHISNEAAPEAVRLVTEGDTYEAARATLDAALPQRWRLMSVRQTSGY